MAIKAYWLPMVRAERVLCTNRPGPSTAQPTAMNNATQDATAAPVRPRMPCLHKRRPASLVRGRRPPVPGGRPPAPLIGRIVDHLSRLEHEVALAYPVVPA